MSIFDIIGKNKSTTHDLMNVKRISNDILYTPDKRKIVYIYIEPINLSVSSPELIRSRIEALTHVIISTGELGIMALNSYQSYESNKTYLSELIQKERNPKLRELNALDRQYFDDIRMTMATSRDFLLVVTFSLTDNDTYINTTVNQILQCLHENQYSAHLAGKQELKRLFAIYYEQANFDSLQSFDGEAYIDEEEMKDVY